MWQKFKDNAIIVALIFVIFGGVFYHCDRIEKLKYEKELEEKLSRALQDTVKHYRNERGELVAEKLTLQADVKELKERESELTENQKELLKRIQEANKNNKVFAAALAELRIEIGKLIDNDPVAETDSSVTFARTTDSISYVIHIDDIEPQENPILTIEKLEIPSESYVEFHWKDDKKEGYPVSVSITHTNPFIKTDNVESFTIPEIQKEELDPKLWDKIKDTFKGKTVAGKILLVAGGIVIGALVL